MEDTARENGKLNGSQIDTGTPNGSTNGTDKVRGKQNGSENDGNKTESEPEDETYIVPEVGITTL